MGVSQESHVLLWLSTCFRDLVDWVQCFTPVKSQKKDTVPSMRWFKLVGGHKKDNKIDEEMD